MACIHEHAIDFPWFSYRNHRRISTPGLDDLPTARIATSQMGGEEQDPGHWCDETGVISRDISMG